MVWMIAAAAAALTLLLLVLNGYAAAKVEQALVGTGRNVVDVRRRWLAWPFAAGLTPLAQIYRVTTDVEGRRSMRLYAYDFGQNFSRHNACVRMFSGGVWRNL